MTNQKRDNAKKSVVDLEKLREKLEKMNKKVNASIFKIDNKFADLTSWRGEANKDLKLLNIWRIKTDEEFAEFKKWEKEVNKKSKKDENEFSLISFMVFDHREIVKENKRSLDELKGMVSNIMTSQDIIIGMIKKFGQEQVFMGHRLERVEDDVNKIKPLVGLT